MDKDSQREKWLDKVRSEIDDSDFELDHRVALHRKIDQAGKLLNGHTDKMSIMFEAFAEELVRTTRQEVNLPKIRKEYVDAGIAAHISSCPAVRRGGLKGLVDRLSDQYPVLVVVVVIWLINSGYLKEILQAL